MYSNLVEALLENAGTQTDNVKESLKDPISDLSTGGQYDKSKLPSEQAWDKERTEKVQVEGHPSSKMFVSFFCYSCFIFPSILLFHN